MKYLANKLTLFTATCVEAKAGACVRKPGSGQAQWGGGCCSGAMSHVGTWAKHRWTGGRIMPRLQPVQDLLGEPPEFLSGHARLKQTKPLLHNSSINEPVDRAFDSPILTLLTLLSLHYPALDVITRRCLLGTTQQHPCACESLVSRPITSAEARDNIIPGLCSFRRPANEHHTVRTDAGRSQDRG